MPFTSIPMHSKESVYVMIDDGSEETNSLELEKKRKTIFILMIITAIFFPTYYIITFRRFRTETDYRIRYWYKFSQNLCAFETCCFAVITITLFSWWFHDAMDTI